LVGCAHLFMALVLASNKYNQALQFKQISSKKVGDMCKEKILVSRLWISFA
jgi:hypothetical protein